ncbi:MAG: MATE family efflux transporter, partial [Ruminococcus sp.]
HVFYLTRVPSPAIISQALISVMTYGLNIILGNISESMVTAYGLYYKIQQFLLFASFGMRDAIMPVTSFSIGMGDKNRVKECVKFGHIYTAVIMLAGTLAVEIFAVPLSDIFTVSGETRKLFISAVRIISICFVFAGANIAFQGLFQAMEGGIQSLVISVCRQVLFIFPFVLIFSEVALTYSGMKWLLWTVFPVAEILTLIIAVILFKKLWKSKKI